MNQRPYESNCDVDLFFYVSSFLYFDLRTFIDSPIDLSKEFQEVSRVTTNVGTRNLIVWLFLVLICHWCECLSIRGASRNILLCSGVASSDIMILVFTRICY